MEYRLYFFVPYNISDIQKGIQAGHVALEYAHKYSHDVRYSSFIENDKTWIILNGGTTRYSTDSLGQMGTLNEIGQSLLDNHILFSTFAEPDLNDALSAICFLADERVWNKENYPDWEEYNPMSPNFHYINGPRSYSEWKELVGGDQNVFLRELLKDKHLA